MRHLVALSLFALTGCTEAQFVALGRGFAAADPGPLLLPAAWMPPRPAVPSAGVSWPAPVNPPPPYRIVPYCGGPSHLPGPAPGLIACN